jgi:hypothetical protein
VLSIQKARAQLALNIEIFHCPPSSVPLTFIPNRSSENGVRFRRSHRYSGHLPNFRAHRNCFWNLSRCSKSRMDCHKSHMRMTNTPSWVPWSPNCDRLTHLARRKYRKCAVRKGPDREYSVHSNGTTAFDPSNNCRHHLDTDTHISYFRYKGHAKARLTRI